MLISICLSLGVLNQLWSCFASSILSITRNRFGYNSRAFVPNMAALIRNSSVFLALSILFAGCPSNGYSTHHARHAHFARHHYAVRHDGLQNDVDTSFSIQGHVLENGATIRSSARSFELATRDFDPYTCGPGRPCSNGACCGVSGNCGYAPAYCGTGCTSNCDAKAQCGQYAAKPGQTCPLNACCSEFGFCGTTTASVY